MLSSPTEALLYWQGQSAQLIWLQHKTGIPVFVLMLVPKGLFPVFSTPLKTDKFTLLPVRTLSCNPIHMDVGKSSNLFSDESIQHRYPDS